MALNVSAVSATNVEHASGGLLMPLSAVRAADLIMARLANWGIFGNMGVGKSTLAASIPASLHGLVVSTGIESIKPYSPRDNIKVIKINQWDDLLQVYLTLKRMLCTPSGEPDPAKAEMGEHFCVIFDTWSRLQTLGMRKLLGSGFSQDPRTLSDAELAKFLRTAPGTLKGYEMWQQLGELSNQWMMFFQLLPCHKIFLFQEDTREPRTPGEMHLTGPMLTPVARNYARESLELLGRLYAEVEGNEGGAGVLDDPNAVVRRINPNAKETRYLLLGQHPAYTTKGPTHLLGYALEDPTWEKLSTVLSPSATALTLNGEEALKLDQTQEPAESPQIAEEVASLF